MNISLNNIKLLLELLKLKKKAELNNESDILTNDFYVKFYALTGTLLKNLVYQDRKLLINLIIEFRNDPTVSNADWLSLAFPQRYRDFSSQTKDLLEQMMIIDDIKLLDNYNKLLTLKNNNVTKFYEAVENFLKYCELYNPELSQDDPLYYNYEQLKKACEQFLERVQDL